MSRRFTVSLASGPKSLVSIATDKAIKDLLLLAQQHFSLPESSTAHSFFSMGETCNAITDEMTIETIPDVSTKTR